MADPFTIGMAAVGTATSVIGGITSAIGTSQKADADARAFQFKAAVARKNAAINRQNSDFALEAGEYNAMREGLTTQFAIGKQKVAQAAGGFDVNTGTYADVRESTQDIGRMDQDTIRKETGRKALNYRQQADANDLEAIADETAAANTRKAGKIGVFSTLLGTAGSVADKWIKAGSAFGGASGGITTYGSNFEVTGYYPT